MAGVHQVLVGELHRKHKALIKGCGFSPTRAWPPKKFACFRTPHLQSIIPDHRNIMTLTK